SPNRSSQPRAALSLVSQSVEASRRRRVIASTSPSRGAERIKRKEPSVTVQLNVSFRPILTCRHLLSQREGTAWFSAEIASLLNARRFSCPIFADVSFDVSFRLIR